MTDLGSSAETTSMARSDYSFILRAGDRGHDRIDSTGAASSYVAGHPESFIVRNSSFNFNTYQTGRPGFGPMRVFGDEVFNGAGCGYNMHPHHNFIIAAFVTQGQLTHVNTVGNVDQLSPGDYYVFSAGSGGKHAELSIGGEDLHVIYMWFLPEQLLAPPSYRRAHFDLRTRRNRIEQLVGDADGTLPIGQDVRVSRLVSDAGKRYAYSLRSPAHAVYAFVLEGRIRLGEADLGRRDSAGLCGASPIECVVSDDETDVLFVETLMTDDARLRAWAEDQPRA
jgi:redox-sensitive bicupin YhaK (pirin superfamily)